MGYFRSFVLLITAILARASVPESCEPADLLKAVQTELSAQRFRQASSLLDTLNRCASLNDQQRFEIGWLYGRARNFQKALAVFDRIPENVPDASTHRYAIGLSQFELHQYREVASTLSRPETIAILDENSANLLAVAYSKLGQYREAYDILEKQVDTRQAGVKTYLNLITVCAEGGDIARAAVTAERAALLFPDTPEVLLALGAANSLSGKTEDASKIFRRALALAPNRPDAVFFSALLDYNAARFAQAVKTIDAALQRGMDISDLHYLKAECLLKLNGADAERVLQESERAARLDPHSAAALTLCGRLLVEKGELRKATVDLEAAHKLEPGARSTTYALARAYRMSGKKQQARALFDQMHPSESDGVQELGSRRLNQTLKDDQPQP